MTGFRVPIMRNGEIIYVDIAETTDIELDAFGDTLSAEEGAAWTLLLARWIRDGERLAAVDLPKLVESVEPTTEN